jgi:hypothetical protein
MTLLIILLLMVGIPAIGSLFFMYQASKHGGWQLNLESWHSKILAWVWGIYPEVEFKNACPYYWFAWLTFYISPLIFVAYIIHRLGKLFKKIPTPDFNLPTLSKSKQIAFIKAKTKAKKYLGYLLLGLVFSLIIFTLATPFIKYGFIIGIITISGVLFIIGFFVLIIKQPTWWVPIEKKINKVTEGVSNIILFIPRLFWIYLIVTPFEKLTGVYTELCPPISWKSKKE